MGDSGEHVGEQSVILFFSFIIYQLIGNPRPTFNLLLWLCMRIVDGLVIFYSALIFLLTPSSA